MPRPLARTRSGTRRDRHRSRPARAGSIPRATRCCCSRSRTRRDGQRRRDAERRRRVPARRRRQRRRKSSSSSRSPCRTRAAHDHQAAPGARLARAEAARPALRGRRHGRCRTHRRRRAARHGHGRRPDARIRARARRRRGDRDGRRGNDGLRLLGADPRHLPRRIHRHRRAQRCRRHRPHHDPSGRCAAGARDGPRRRVRASASRTRPSTSSRRCRIRPGECSSSAMSSCTPTREHPSRSTPSGRTTCAYRARRPRARAGRLGTVSYTVSDGTEDRGASVQGEATVYLLPPAPELAPIAVDDTIVVRAGSQIDIPVLDNDFAPAGGRPTLDPSSVVSSSDAALAFASGDLLRYLAPEEPGEYGIRYSVYTTGSPTLADTADVRIQVLSDDANRAPLPETLEGRVLSGASALIEFDGFGMDPDGDVVTLDRILDPARERGRDDLGRRLVDPLFERPGAPRSGVVPLSRRGCVRRDGRGDRPSRRARRRVEPESDHLHRLRPGAGGRGPHDPREPSLERPRPHDGRARPGGRPPRPASDVRRRKRESRVHPDRRASSHRARTRPS